MVPLWNFVTNKQRKKFCGHKMVPQELYTDTYRERFLKWYPQSTKRIVSNWGYYKISHITREVNFLFIIALYKILFSVINLGLGCKIYFWHPRILFVTLYNLQWPQGTNFYALYNFLWKSEYTCKKSGLCVLFS